jgi:diguanylate cyclase (GGDEF)-like protein/PAS domain S-box-containing protein
MRASSVQRILKALGQRGGESLLVVAVPAADAPAREVLRHARAAGVQASMFSIPDAALPDAPLLDLLKGSPCAVLFAPPSFEASAALRELCTRQGLRVACIPPAEPGPLDRLLDSEVPDLASRAERLASLLEGARRVRLRTPSGTDLSFDVSGRPVQRDLGDRSAPGSLGRLPAAAVRLAPVEGSVEGEFVADRGPQTLRLRFSQGRVGTIPDPRLEALVEPHGPEARLPGVVSLGLHPFASVTGHPAEDACAAGAVVLSLGGNLDAGGRIDVPLRLEFAARGVAVEVDGRPVDPALLAPAAPGASALPPAEVGSLETFQLLFQNSNDPQYVLDLDSQRFLEANPAFEQVTGWTRDELLDTQVNASKLVARESMPTYQQKRETRRMVPAERYDLKLLTKAGEKLPVELSVRRLRLGARDVVVGTLRDLSHRKKLEQEMWEKIEELGYANSRIYALTEKIKRVPELTPQLLHITHEEELLERTAQLLCAREGLGYADVNFYLLRDDALELAHSSIKTKKRALKLSADHRLVRILTGSLAGGMTHREAVLPLKGRERNLGVMEVFFHPKEIEVLQDNERALKGYRDLLETLSNVIGLLVENLHLYDRVRRQSIVDHLTGVYNRRYFDAKLFEEFNRAARYSREFALVLIDVDKFKEINDKMSYKQGDQVLIETARVFKAHSREVDMVCRYGGDEFAMLLPETGYENALAKAEQLRQVVRQTEFGNTQDPSKPLRLTLSIGVTAWSADLKTPDELLRGADEAVHLSKRSGRDCVCGKFRGSLQPRPGS